MLFLLTALLGGAVQAEVYLLGPRSGRAPAGSFAEMSGAGELMVEPVIFNGVETEQRVLLLQQPLETVLTEWQSRFVSQPVAAPGGIVLRLPSGPGRHERVLLVGGGDLGAVTTAFVMELPDVMPPAPVWAAGLPVLPGATAAEVVELPARGSQMVTFTGGAGMMPAADRALRAAGMLPVGGVSGGMYLDAAGKEIVMVAIRPDGNGMMFRAPLGRGGRR